MERDFNIHNWQAKFLKEESSNRQSAVEWLQSQISYKENGVDLFEDLFNKAKQIEEKQIIEAFEDGGSSESMNGQEYYNEVYR